ncbi:MAG: hypothetical protein ABR581_02730 [Thermoleophilaceae bacterium]
MRNRGLHDALREFALEAAAFLVDEQRAGAELEFDVLDEGGKRGPALYRYRALTDKFLDERWGRLRELPTCARACDALGEGASAYLRVNGLRGEQAEPALQTLLGRLYEDATSFGFPEERFERVYRDVEQTLYRDTVRSTVLAPLPGLRLESERLELGDGLTLVRAETLDVPPEALWPDAWPDEEPAVLCLLERDVSADGVPLVEEARERFRRLVTGLRLFRRGGVTLAALGWTRAIEGRWSPVELEGAGPARGEPLTILREEQDSLREFLDGIEAAALGGTVAWALGRFELGCSRGADTDALSDYLLALRALLDATSETGLASLSLRLAALCAEEQERHAARRRIELALALERWLMGGRADAELQDWIGSEPPTALVAETEAHLRALLRDVVCGYLDPDLKRIADELLLESREPVEIEVRDLREESTEASTDEFQAAPVAPPRARRITAGYRPGPAPGPPEPDEAEAELQGVTPSVDWVDDDPESYSAPV